MKAPNLGRGDLLADIARGIEKSGWYAIGVFPSSPEDPPCQFVYSVGFQEKEHPEVIVMGLHLDLGHGMLRRVHEMIELGHVFADRDRSSDVIANHDVEFRVLPADGDPLNWAKTYYGVDQLEALQLVWPDRHGRLPGDSACDSKVAYAQNLNLARERSRHA